MNNADMITHHRIPFHFAGIRVVPNRVTNGIVRQLFHQLGVVARVSELQNLFQVK